MTKLPKEKRDKILMIGGGTLALALGLYWFVISAQYKTLAEYETQLTELDDEISQIERKIKLAKLGQAQAEEVREELRRVEANMLPAEQLNNNLWVRQRIDAIRAKYNLEPRQFADLGAGTTFLNIPNFPYKAAAYQVEVLGFYHDFGQFLAEVEGTFPFFSVQDLKMVPLVLQVGSERAPGDEGSVEQPNPAEMERLVVTFRLVVLTRLRNVTS